MGVAPALAQCDGVNQAEMATDEFAESRFGSLVGVGAKEFSVGRHDCIIAGTEGENRTTIFPIGKWKQRARARAPVNGRREAARR